MTTTTTTETNETTSLAHHKDDGLADREESGAEGDPKRDALTEMAPVSAENGGVAAKAEFLCGVIEGFYGKPWTRSQRMLLFRRMKDLGLNSYIYAPKDDYKHRAFWRDSYSSTELSELSSLIAEAKSHGVSFYYAISPGIDILFSSERDVTGLKKKLQQMQLCGCDGFAILFDDIDPELSPVDSTIFQTFGHAQAAVTNDVYKYLGEPKTFLFCPTEYCATRAVPNVSTSEYLRTIGDKLHPNIDIMWTGPQVISREISVSSIEQVGRVLRRHPVIWDNYHANDYDQSRVFLGPLDGRPPELKLKLNGFFTNPNCEFFANWVAFHSLASWNKCSVSMQRLPSESGPENASGASSGAINGDDESKPKDVDMAETSQGATTSEDKSDASDGDATATTSMVTDKPNGDCPVQSVTPPHPFDAITAATIVAMKEVPPEVYMPERALFRALEAWLPEFRLFVDADGKRQDAEDDIKTISSSTSMSACESTASAVDESPMSRDDVTSGLPDNAAAAVVTPTLSNGDGSAAPLNALAVGEPMDCASSPSSPKPTPTPTTTTTTTTTADMTDEMTAVPEADQMQIEANETVKTTITSTTVGLSTTNTTESTLTNSSNISSVVESSEVMGSGESNLSLDDLLLFSDLYHAPFNYGPRGVYMLNEFKWLKENLCLVTREIGAIDRCKAETQHQMQSKRNYLKRNAPSTKLDCGPGNTCCEATRAARLWHARAHALIKCCQGVKRLYRHLCNTQNRPLLYELLPYLRNIIYVVNLLLSYIKWMGGTGGLEKKFFGSGVNEPWVFRGGLVAEFQRLLPSHSLMDFDPLTARPIKAAQSMRPLGTGEAPMLAATWTTTGIQSNAIRPYFPFDKLIVYEICKRSLLSVELFGLPSKFWSKSSSSSSDGPSPQPPFGAPDQRRPDLFGDVIVSAFVAHSPDLIYVIEDEVGVFGFCCGVVDSKQFFESSASSWLPEMLKTYGSSPSTTPSTPDSPTVDDPLQPRILEALDPYLPPPEILERFPGLIRLEFLPRGADNVKGARTLVHTIKLAMTVKSCKGAHLLVPKAANGKLEMMLDVGFQLLVDFRHQNVDYHVLGLAFEPIAY